MSVGEPDYEQVVHGLGNNDVPVEPHEVGSSLVEALLVDVLDTLEDDGLDHPDVFVDSESERVGAELFLLFIDGGDERGCLGGIDGDCLATRHFLFPFLPLKM